MKLKSYNLIQAMNALCKVIVLVLLLSAAVALTGVGLNPIRPLKLNKGSSTKYMFFINPETEILSKAQLKVTFPAEFDKTVIASKLSCLSSSLSYSWTSVPCYYSDGSVIVTLGTVKNEATTVLISQPVNPTIYQMSSYFALCLMVDSMTTTCDKTFGKVVFPEAPVVNTPAPTSLYPVVNSLNTKVVGQSSTYEFRFSFSISYGSGNTVRITFPTGFQTSSNPICQVSGTYNQVITTFVWPDQRTVECQSINKTLYLNQTLKVVGILNPNYAGTFGTPADPFIIEILKGTTTIVLEEISALQSVTITAGSMTGSIVQANNFINADVQYTFYLNLLNSLTSDNFILIKFDSSWILYQENCRVISGITMAASSSLVCSNYTQASNVYLKVSNFLSASVSNQLVFTVKVRSPNTPNTYSVGIQTANTKGVLDSMTTSVSLNSTYGDYKMLSINAIVAQSNVPVSGTGPLELTFFLNYDLPQTNVLTYGKFLLKIYPQIPLPPPLTNGVLKCYFFNTIPAQTCTWDVSDPLLTLVTINTPLNNNFQYSQIPVTITTEGAVDSSHIGITIADIVTRYRFQLQAFMQNNTVIPTEVYFSEYIAAPIALPLTYYALSKEVNEKTHLRFQFTSPYNFVSPLADDLRIKIEFLAGGAWADSLGFQPNEIYKRFPCVFSDNSLLTLPPEYNSDVTCDLYTYLTGPHASLTNTSSRGPYLLVSGFTKQMLINSQVRLEVGGLLIGSSSNLQAKVRFSLVQQTPDMLTKYVQLYYNELSLFTTAAQGVATPATTGVADTLANPLINTVNNHTIAYTAPGIFFAAIYQFDQISTPSFPNQFVSCSRVTSLIANWCTYLGYPVNTVVEYSQSGTFSTSVSSVINITSGIYSGSFPALVRVMSTTSLTLMKTSFTVVYTPRPIVSISFYNSDSTIYKANEHYYTLDFYPITSTPDNGFIRLQLANYGNFGEKPFCYSTSLVAIVAELGVQCTVESATSLKIYNIKGLTAGNLVRIKIRLFSTLSSSTTFRPQITVHTHYSLAADPSIVDSITNYNLDSAVTNYYTKPNEFKIDNPRVTLETPRVDYVGPLELLFNPSADVLSSQNIKLILNNHAWNGGVWSTPNSVTSDPLVCMINRIRVSCTYTLSPLAVTMNVSPAGITNGQNNLITLDTEYLSPSNGIKHPSQGGHYNLYLQFLDSSAAVIQQQSFYQEVLPPRLRNFYVNSSVNDVGVENMFYIQFELGSTILNAFNHATLYSRIYIELPTKDPQGNDLFLPNLGGYQQTGDLVGCVFDTWNTYYVDPVGGYRLQCRLIMSQAPGEPTRVEVLHHGAFSSSWRYMRLWMAKVYNPVRAVTSIPISIRMEHVQVSTNNVFELYYDTFDVFMNSQTPATPTINSRNCNAYDGTVLVSGPINQEGYFRFYPRSIGGFDSNYGYYFVIDMTSDFKPSSLETRYNNNYCHGSYFYFCLSFPDINYIVIYSKSDNYHVNMYVWFGPAISQTTTVLKVKVWSSYRDIGYTNIQMISTCWNQIISTPSSVSLGATAGNGYGYYKNKRRLEVVATFTLGQPIPITGSIQIKFPSSVPRIYPHCRSMTNLDSVVAAEGTSQNGEIGCLVQNTRSWVITGFNALAAGSVVKIVGEIDMPATSGNLGTGEIITYNNTHPTNGFIIDYYSNSNFFITVNNDIAHNVDSAITLEETLPLRAGYTGPLRLKFKLTSALDGPNAGTITVRVPSVSTIKVAGGFAYSSSNKYVCQIVEVSTFQETGCIVTSVTQDTTASFPNFLFTVITSGPLTANTLYKLVLTTHNGIQPEGLTFPTAAGTYKVDVNFDVTGSSNSAVHNHLYLEVYGTKFSYIFCHQLNSIPSRKNLIWLKITPTTTIQTTQQLILEIPTKSSAGAVLFADDLGTGLADGAVFPIDILDTTFNTGFMACRLFHGDNTFYKPARVVCGNLQGTIASTQILWWAIKVVNPALPPGETKLSVPFFLYSVEQGTTYKTNFDVIENAVYLRADYASYNDVATPISSTGQLQTLGSYIDMISRNNYNLASGEYYLTFFNFPLRNNGVVTNGCSYPGSSIYGDAVYHLNLWAIVCTVTGATIGVPGGGATTRNLRISGFFTPFYYLSAAERVMECYGYNWNTRYTSSGGITDGYPNEGPKTSSTPSLTITPVSGSYIAGTRDDYTFSFTFSAANNDLSFVKKIALIFPSSIDYNFLESDCVQAPGSQVEVAECFLDTVNEVIWIRPVVKSTYTSDMSVAITTRGLAIQNPVSNYNVNKNLFVIKYYTWQNITEPGLAPTSNNNYCYLMINNLGSSPFSYSPNPSPYYVPTFTYLQYPHQRYYTDTPFSSVIHRAPFQLEFYPAVDFVGQTGNNYHYIKIAFPSTFGDAAMFTIRDLQVFRPVCYLNNQRIRQCSIDTVANEITMTFLFGLSSSSKYHLKMSILDSRNADIDGFLSSAAVSNIVLLYKPYGSSSWRYTETDQFPTLYSLPTGAETGPFRGIVAGTADYGHTVPSQINYLNLQLTFNRTDITGLVFEFPSVDRNGNSLFTSDAQLVTAFLSQENGGSYPCGNHGFSAGGKVRCLLLRGSYLEGLPTRIIMSEFTYVTQMNCRLVFRTPPNNGVWLSVKVKAFGGQPAANNPYGTQFMGDWQFNEIFQVNTGGSATGHTYTANYYRCPSLSPWRNSTDLYVFSQETILGGTRTSVAELVYYDESSAMTDKMFCEPSLGYGFDYDDLLTMSISVSGVEKRYAYFIRTHPSNVNMSISTTYGWTLKYLKCKHYSGFSINAYFFFGDTSIEVATNTFSSSYCNSGYTSGVSSPVLKQFSQSHHASNGTDVTYLQEYDITPSMSSLSNFNFRNGDQMVLSIKYDSAFWGTITGCTLLGGIASTSLTSRATCVVRSNTNIYINNVAGFIANPALASSTNNRVKVKFTANGGSVMNNAGYYFYMSLYANYDAYNNNYQPIFYEYSGLTTTTALSSCYWYDTSTCVLGQSTASQGTFLLQKVTDTYLQVVFKASGNLVYSTTVYTHDFVVTFNGFTFGTTCSISDLTMEMSLSPNPGTGYNNSFPADSLGCGSDYVEVVLNSRQWNQYWGGLGPASDNQWTPAEYLIMYITIAPNAATSDLPNLQHDYLFVEGSYSYKTTGSWTTNIYASLEYTPQDLASSASISTLTNNRGASTEMSFTLTSLKTSLGPLNNNYYLLAEFIGSAGWTSGSDPFAYTNPGIQNDFIACKCIAGTSPLTVSISSPVADTTCKRRLPSGSFTNYAILIGASASTNQDLTCFLPEFGIAADMSFRVEFKLVYEDNYPGERYSGSTVYSSLFRVQSNTLSFSGLTPNMNTTYVSAFTSSEGTNFYASATNVGSTYTGTYSLGGNWGANFNTPYVYINFLMAGPIPIQSFCSDTNTYLQCRVYTDRLYVVVAQLKSSSVQSYSISNGGTALKYPSAQYSVSTAYGATIYVGSGTWSRSSSLSRAKTSLVPVSTNSFLVFSDIYGSRRSYYSTNIFFSVSPAGQTLFNYAQTGSKMVISWSSQTTGQNCQVWVQTEPTVELVCDVSGSTLTITSPYYDYTTSNNIMISLGLTNPTSASTTFNLLLYSYYFSASIYSLTISTSATYSTDTTYTSGSYTLIGKSTVIMYPFESRISTVANAPLRARFRLPSSSVSNAWGTFTLTYSQIGYSTKHLCYILAYPSYAAMMQQTQRGSYKVSCTSSGNTLTVTPAVTLTVSAGNYYQLVMMPLDIGSTGCTALGCVTQAGYQQTNFDVVNLAAYNNRSSPSIISQQSQKLYSYEGASKIGLQHIYILCVQPRTTSLYLSINLNFTSSNDFPAHYLEISLLDLSLTAFSGYAAGDIFPCQLSSNFLAVSSRKTPQCRVALADKLNAQVRIRIQNIGSLSPQTYWVSLDDIVLPTPSSSDNNNKFDVSISFRGPSNLKYENYFPEVFQVDNTNTTVPVTSSTYTFNNPAYTGFGNLVTGQIVFTWPFDSSSSSYESKLALNFRGGYSSVWQDINALTFLDSAVGTYQLLWVNKALKKFVFLLPNKGSGASTTLNLTGLNNPYPYQREDYNVSTDATINFYNNQFLQNSKTFSQPSFSIFTMNPSLVFINQNTPSNEIDNYPASNSIAPGSTQFLTLSLEFDETQPNLQTRNLNTIQIKFTSGVSFIRECRAMRNDSQWVHTMTTCQPFHDGTNWNVYLYQVANSQLSKGWWVQILANYSSGSLAYTSYVISSANSVVEYQNSYTVTLGSYNTSRSIPTVLSWLDNRYVLFYHQTQYRFLDAVSGQTTPYLRFRFTQVRSCSTVDDRLYIYLPDDLAQQPYTPVHNNNHLVVQFLPALSAGDSDFSVGFFSDGYLKTSSSKYYIDIFMRYGGIHSGGDYLLQISEYNTADSSFYMSQSPNRQQIDWLYQYYPSVYDYRYYDTFYIQSYVRFRQVQLLHTTTTVGDYDTLTIKYKPYGALSGYSSTRQISLRLSVMARYSLADAGVAAIYSADGKTINSGSQYSGVVVSPNNNQIYTIQYGQHSIENAPLRFVLAKQNAYSDNTEYTWVIPLIKNPTTAFVSLRFNLTLVCSPTSGYQYIHNHYESINEYYTVADTASTVATSITNNLRAVQTNANVDLALNLGTISLDQWDTAVFKLNNALKGLLPAITSPNDTSNYDYSYFPRLDMIVARKKSTSVLTNIGIGASSTAINFQSTFGVSWVWVFNSSNVATATNPYTLYRSTPPTLTLTTLNSYSSSSVTLREGYQSTGSTAYYQATFTSPIINQTGQIRLLFDKTKFSPDSLDSCRAGANVVRSTTDSIALRCYRTSEGFRLVGFSSIPATTSVNMFFKLKALTTVASSPISIDIFGMYEDNSTRVSLAQIGTISIASSTVLSSLKKVESMTVPYWATLHSNNYYLIEGVFNLRDTKMFNGDYFYVSEPGWTLSGNRRLLIKQNSSSVTEWTQLDGYYVSANRYRFELPTDQLIPQSAEINTQYIFRYTSYYSDSANGYWNGFIMGGPGTHRFYLQSYDNSQGYRESGYFDFVPFPKPFTLTVTNRYLAAGRQTMLDLYFSIDYDLPAGADIVIKFDTSNLLAQMFQDELQGADVNGETHRYLDCNEWNGWNLISDSKIVCLLQFGNRLANPPQPANLTITTSKIIYGWGSPDNVHILIANVKNPSTVGMNTGVTLSTNIPCDNQQNLPCSAFEARGYYVTSAATQNTVGTATTFSSSSNLVLATGLTHTFTLTLTASLTTSHAIYIVYPQNFQGVMPLTCAVSSFSCYVFPTRRWVVLLPTGSISAGLLTLSITSMNNGYYSKSYSTYFKVTVARGSAVGDIYNIDQPAFTPVPYTFANSSVATSVAVQTTQTPSMYLRNYANTVIFSISNIFSDGRAKAIYIKAPADVTSWDPSYCNASITNTSNFNYPLRFICTVDPDPAFLRLTLDEDMASFSAIWAIMTIRLHAKFTLANFPTTPTLYQTAAVNSGAFQVFSSSNATSSSSLYYISQCSVVVSISQNQVPVISVINFNTQSFANRLARVNNKEVFYLLFKPLVDVTLGKIVFTIPSQFNYPGVFSLDNCLMIGRTTSTQTSCQLSRYQGQTLVTLTPDIYDNNVKIFQVGSVDKANWFTAPSLPGDFYEMNVAVYAANGTLVSKQTRSISPVYGDSFDIPSIVVKNVQDQSTTFATYDLRFITGNLQIPPGAVTTATTQTSELQFIFQNFNGMNPTNVFSNDLGTGLTSGSEVGCIIKAGLVALAGKRMKCLLKVGTSQTDKPTIRIINYNFIDPATTIQISFARIQTLPGVLANTISIGAKIFYNDIGSSTYLYIPTPVITVPTNITNVLASTTVDWKSKWYAICSFSGTNIVLEPTIFSLSFGIPYYNLWVYGGLSSQNCTGYGQYSYSSTGADDEFILLTFYPATLLDKNNPVTVSCAQCTQVEVFYAAGMVRFRHTQSKSPTSWTSYLTFTFTNFPTSSYSLLNQPVYVNFQIFKSYQCIIQLNISASVTRTVEKCTKFNFGVVSVSSLNGGEIGVTYLFSIKTNHFVPSNGALSITLPIEYGNMLTNLATCTLVGFTGTNCYCRILTPSRVDIYANGTELSTSTTYSVRITGLQNPNVDSSSFAFIVTSYYEQNIYLGRKICENQIKPPTINVKPLRTCSLSWTPQYSNQKFNASYVFQLSCSDVFRGDSTLYLTLPASYATTNPAGTIPCSSYESTTLVAPVCTLSSINNVFTLSTSIDASSQSALSILVNLVNPINGTYSTSAYVTSKGTQYASAAASSITILSNSYLSAPTKAVELLNTPKEAGLSSTYVFKVSPVSGFTPSNMGISFPSNFYLQASKLTVAVANTPLNNFFSYLTYNNIQALISNASAVSNTWIGLYPAFTVSGTAIYLQDITKQVSSSQWSYVFVSGVHNPSEYIQADFTVAYYLISQGFQALQWAYQGPLTYYISPPPQYISITNVTVSDYDLLYPANYNFTFSATSSYVAMAGRNLSYIVVIPTFYKNTLWANTAPTCKFAQLAVASSCYSYQGEIIVTETFLANYSRLTLTISTLLNPSLPTNCKTTDTTVLAQTFFIIRVIDTLSNSFLYESSSVVDSKNCLTFSSIRIPISLEYPLVMTAGLAYNITYGLTKPSSNLKISASVDSSGFTFSPSIVDFNDYYTLSKSTQVFLRSDVTAGSYVIKFSKSEATTLTYFRNILPVTVTVKAASNVLVTSSPTISIPTMSDSTIGYPVIVPLKFSIPSSTEMTMFLTISEESSQTLAQYSPFLANFTITPRIVNILPQQTAYNFTITQGLRVVPPPLTLNFKITSNYPIVHQLTTPTMYLCFDRDPKHNVLYPPLRVTITPFLSSCNQQDVGKAVTNIMISNDTSESSAGSVTPKVIDITVLSAASTGASLRISSLTAGKIYYLCIPQGYPAVTDSAMMASMKQKGIAGVSTSAALTVSSGSTAQVNYYTTVNVSGLSQSSGYVFYAVSSSNLGTSPIFSIHFNTSTLSNGAQMTLYFSQIVPTLDLVNALVQVMRITPTRVKILTSIYKLQQKQAAISSSDNKILYGYDIVIAPDSTNDIVAPLDIVANFANTPSTLDTFSTYLSSFDHTRTIKYFQLMPVLPIVVTMPFPVAIKLYAASFKMKFKSQTTIYAVLYEHVGAGSPSLAVSEKPIIARRVADMTPEERKVAPSSNQIIAGTDYTNTALGSYKVFKQNTDTTGLGSINWQDLKPQSVYEVFITAASPRPYDPPLVWLDGQVITFSFSTLPNANVGTTEKQKQAIKQFAKYNPKLADAMGRFVELNSRKTTTTSNP